MSTLSIASFQKILSTTTANGIVSLKDGQLSVSSGDREYELANLSADDKERNRALRQALLTALSDDSGSGAPYLAFLTKKLLGESAENALDTSQLRNILNRHVTVKTLAGAAGKSAPASSGAAFAKAAGKHATSLKNLKIDNQAEFFASVDKAARNPNEQEGRISQTFAQTLANAKEELSKAYKLKGAAAGTPKGLKTLEDAAKSLADLADFVRSVVNRLARKEGIKREQNMLAKLNLLVDFASARQSELHVIAGTIEGVTEFEKTVGTTPNVKQMMATLAGKMHATEDVAAQIDARLKTLNDRMTAWSDDPKEKSSDREISEISQELTKADTFADEVKSAGLFWTDKGSMQVEKSFLEGLEKHLSATKKALAKAASFSRETGMLKMIDEAYGEKNIQPRIRKDVPNRWYALGMYVRNAFTDRILTRTPIDQDFINATWTEIAGRKKLIGDDGDTPKAFYKDEFVIFADKMLALQKAQSQETRGILTASHKDVKMLLQGKIAMGTLLGARMYGFSDEMIDPELDDRNLVSFSKRGSGQVNTVTTVKHKVSDGNGGTKTVTHVFKPETTALIGTGWMTGADAQFSGSTNWIAQINRSAHEAAKLIGAGEVMPKVTVGMFQGHFGFFMEEAKGASGADYRLGTTSDGKALKKPFPKKKSLNAQQLATLTGSLMKGTNELMWTDWLTGQCDRHGDNFLVSIDETTCKATVKGIDNDLSFSSERVGLRTFRLNKNRLNELLSLGPNQQPMTVDEFNALFPNNRLTPVLDKKDKKVVYEINAGDNNSLITLLGGVFGMNSFARPTVIGQTMYDKIMDLKKLSPEKTRECIVKMMGPGYTDGQVDATLLRLREMIAYLDTFKPNQLIADDKWNDAETQTTIRSTFRSKKDKFDCPKTAPKALQQRIHSNFSKFVKASAEDYFVRNFGKLLP